MADDFVTPDPIRYFLTIWSILAATLSFAGNTVVLVASRKFRALKVDKVSVKLIENLAVADLGYTLVGIIPTIGALIANNWIYGRQFCVVNKVLTNIFFNMTTLLVSLLSVSKLTCLLFPIHARTRRSRHAVILVTLVWVLVTTYSVVSTAVSNPELYYDTVTFQCWVNYTNRIPFGTILVGWMLLMNVIIIISTTWLLVQVKILTLGLKKGAIAIVVISVIFTIATLPAAIIMIMKMAHVQFGEEAGPVFNIVTTYIFYISNFFNPAVYYFTIRSFKHFVDEKVFRLSVPETRNILTSTSPSRPTT